MFALIAATDPAMVVGYVLVTLGFLAISGVVLWKVTSHETKLVLLGLVVAVAGVGYGSVASPGAVAMASTLMKIGFVLVLGGVACSLLSYLSHSGESETTAPGSSTDEI